MDFESIRIKKASELEVGSAYYKGYGLGSNSFVHKIFVLGPPYIGVTGSLFVSSDAPGGFTSLCDMNVEGGGHNHHFLFREISQAEAYVDYCKENNVGGFDPFNDPLYDDFHF